MQSQFPNCGTPRQRFVATVSYTARCPNGSEYSGGFDWKKVGSDIFETVSGLLLLRKTVSGWVFLAAHDALSLPRLSLIQISNSGDVTSSGVDWSGPPVDIEALFVHRDDIFAASSAGTLYRLALSVDETSVSTIDSVYFGAMITGDFEAAFIHEINGIWILVVASRGNDSTPSTIAWKRVSYPSLSILGATETSTFSAPFPTVSNVRHVSDLRVDIDGNLFVCSSSDPGDNGPFSSAVFHVGSFFMDGVNPALGMMDSPREVYRSDSHKIEAICMTPNDSLGMVVGADDENLGGFIFAQGQRVLGVPVGDPVTVTRQASSCVSLEDAERLARDLARKEAMAVMACRYVARDCVTPQCGYYFYAPVCCYGSGATPALAADAARADALAWAALYCPE